jgi:hypothetical protein
METDRRTVIGIIVYGVIAAVLIAGYGWFVIATSGRDDVPRALRFLMGVIFVTFGGVAGTGLWVRLRKLRQRKN